MLKYQSLLDMFEEASRHQRGMVFFNKTEPVDYPYQQAQRDARALGEKLVAWGVKPGDKVLIVLAASPELVASFFGILHAGGIPCILPELSMVKVLDDGIDKTVRIARQLHTDKIITNRFNQGLYREAGVALEIETLESLQSRASHPLPALQLKPDDLAVVQATSGSTGTPKCVMLSHGNLLANLEQIRLGTKASEEHDCVVAWLPFYHDMGLIGCFLFSAYMGVRGVFMTPSHFLRRPLLWLKAIMDYRGTMSPAPNFAYAYCCTRLTDDQIASLDLSSWRTALCGSEMVEADILRFFARRFASTGFNPDSFVPCYGLAEASLAVTMHSPGQPLMTLAASRSALAAHGRLEAPRDAQDRTEIVDCGAAVPGASVRIVDDAGICLGEGQLGHIEVFSPSVMQGYFGDAERSRQSFRDGWLVTGDLGFLKDGHLYVSGRQKDLIIIRGEKHLPTDFEKAAATVQGVREGRVAAFGVFDAEQSTELVYLVCEIDEENSAMQEELREQIARKVSIHTGTLPAHVGFVPKDTIPKTTSGKLQRGHLRKMYLEILSQAQ